MRFATHGVTYSLPGYLQLIARVAGGAVPDRHISYQAMNIGDTDEKTHHSAEV
jgi:hypothetical protein